MKTIVLFGAGKSASVLIKYLIKESEINHWKFIVADASRELIVSKTGGSKFAEAVQLDINNDMAREKLIQRAHVIISMMPPSLHFLIAKDCVEYRKHLLTASYLDNNMKSLRDEINHRKLLFLCEMGLDPGIDHMSAMKIIDDIKEKGGVITSFKSHCGGLIAPESDNNPWHYKISWNPRNVVLAGNAGAVYLEHGEEKTIAYEQLFDDANKVKVDGLEDLAYYPNRDSLSYIPVYKLHDAKTFVRTTLRYPSFFTGWNAIVGAGLTNDKDAIVAKGLTFKKWSESIEAFVTDENRSLLQFLGLFDEIPVPSTAVSSADILQHLLETKLAMKPEDKDMIVMLHEFVYELNGEHKQLQSSLIVKGEDNVHTAMAKTVGLPLGIAAKIILNGTLTLTGLHIPILKEIYEPVLQELENEHVIFKESLS